MADNLAVDNGALTDYSVATDKVTYSGDADQDLQLFRPVHVAGAEGSRTVVALTDSFGLNVHLTDAAGQAVITSSAATDGLSAAAGQLAVRPLNYLYNGATWDRVRGSTTGLQVIGGAAHDAAWVAANWPVVLGAFASAATPSAVSTDGDVAHLWSGTRGQLAVMLVDAAGAAVAPGTQYAEDAPMGTGTGTLSLGHASAGAPSPVSTDGDAVGLWASRRGQLHTVIGADDAGSASAYVHAAITNDALGPQNGLVVVDQLLGYNAVSTNWDRLRTIEGVSASPTVDTGILAVGTGPGFDRKTNPTGVAATSTSNAVEVLVNGADALSFHVTTIGTTPGSMIIETTADDTNWATAGAVLRLGALDTWIEGSFVPAVNDVYMVRAAGQRRVRYRVNAVYASGTATVKVTSAIGSPIIKTVEMPPAPHKIGYALVGVSAQYTSAQTSTTIGPTISSTQRLVVTGIQIGAGGTVAATQCSVYFGTGAFSRGTSKAIFDHEFAPSATSKPGYAAWPGVPWMGAADEELKITSVGAANPLTVTIWYYIVAA